MCVLQCMRQQAAWAAISNLSHASKLRGTGVALCGSAHLDKPRHHLQQHVSHAVRAALKVCLRAANAL